MKPKVAILTVVLAVLAPLARTQDPDAPAPDPAQQKAAATFSAKPNTAKSAPKVLVKPASLTPLSPRERTVQLLDRFTFGPRPGEVDRVLAQGPDKWLEQQLNPDSIPDNALARRLADYPTLSMSTAQMMDVFPDRGQVGPIAEGKVPYPNDPILNAVFEVQVYKLNAEKDRKRADGSSTPPPEPTDAEKAAQKKQDQATAARIFGDLLAQPKNQRMAAIIALPVEQRIVLTAGGNLTGDQRNLLFADFTPREKETFLAMSGQVSSSGNIARELSEARVLRDVLTERQLQQVMTDFWFNHFNIYAPKDSDQWYTASYERDVIRAHALGSFRDLLLATATSPAMMVYLDNWLSIGPDSLANGVDPHNSNSKKGTKGLNENYGREVMELHTVGVNGGYTQADVTALAAILTGWGVERPNQGGPFQFDYKRHEPGPKVWYGYEITDDGQVTKLTPGTRPVGLPAGATFGPSNTPASPDSYKQGVAALSILAASPQTAHFISLMLAQYFVADIPPPALVDRLQKTYMDTHGDIKSLLRALISSPEFNSRQYFHNKVKTPEEFIASAFRASATDPANPGALVGTIKTMGMELYHALPPTGYYLTADQWMNSTALVSRLNFAYALTNNKFANQKFDAPRLLAMGLLAPSFSVDISGARPASAQSREENPSARMIGIAASEIPASAAPAAGAQVAMRVLEATMIGAPVSAQTNQLINKQLQQQPPNANPTDTLNLLTALVLGSPEFQLR